MSVEAAGARMPANRRAVGAACIPKEKPEAAVDTLLAPACAALLMLLTGAVSCSRTSRIGCKSVVGNPLLHATAANCQLLTGCSGLNCCCSCIQAALWPIQLLSCGWLCKYWAALQPNRQSGCCTAGAQRPHNGPARLLTRRPGCRPGSLAGRSCPADHLAGTVRGRGLCTAAGNAAAGQVSMQQQQ
jgi:hypothetical protein